jgi:riboflavin kinase/FMN adenylyltransferase
MNVGPSALAIGNFDGVHIGHQALISDAAQWASRHGAKPAVLTFDPHPSAVVAPDRVPLLICSLKERLRLLEAAGAAQVVVLPFTEETARLTPEQFVEEIVVKMLNSKALFVGENFRFGHKQAGTPDTLKRLGTQCGFVPYFLPPVKFRGEVVSSSLIRRYLSEGSVGRAGRLLGRCFSVGGPVVPGRGIGKKETVPTLNLRPVAGQIVPHGIYVSETLESATGRHWQSVTSVGHNPTFGETELTIETHLLEPLDGPSPADIEVRFRRFIRSERTFPSAEALRKEIFRDVARAKTYWRLAAALTIPVGR